MKRCFVWFTACEADSHRRNKINWEIMLSKIYSRVRPRILDIVMSAFSEKTFSVCILSALSGFAHNDLHDGVSFYYKVPENLCRTHIVNGVAQESRFAAGAIMAVFDEVSTYATTMKDKTHRPGLSVHLSTEILQNVYAGEEVTVLTQADKLGKSIGFCSMELLNKKGELVARGKHIRFLQMGMTFDLIAHRWMLPWTITYYENFHGRKEDLPSTTGGQGKHIFKLPAGFPSLDGTGRIFDVLGLNRTEHIKYGTDLHNKSATHCSDNGRIDPDKEQQFGMTVLPVTSNLLGNMHGGAVACAVEHACVLARTRAPIMLSGSSSIGKNADNINSSTSSTSNNSSSEGSVVGAGQGEYLLECCVTGVEVRYINAMKGDLVITTVEDIYAPPLPRPDSLGVTWSSKSFGKVLSRDGTVCAEYVCSWAMC